jgi:hypothetical protein
VFEDPEVEKVVVEQARSVDVVEIDGVQHVTALEIIFPCPRINENAEIAYVMYNSMRQLLCTSKDGITKRCANPDTGEVTEGECLNENCPYAQPPKDKPDKPAACGQVMRLRFILPSVPGLGVWQLDTRSKWSMSSVLRYMRTLKAEITRGQLAGIRLRLYRGSEMIPDKYSRKLRQHWPLHLVCPLSFDEYGEEMAKARAMTFDAAEVEEFSEEASEDLFVNGGGLPEGEPETDGPPTVDPETGEIILPGEEPMEAEIVPEPELAVEDGATGEPTPGPHLHAAEGYLDERPATAPKPAAVKMVANEQANDILRLAERTWTDRATATESFKTWLGQMFEGVQNVRQLTYQQAVKTIDVLQKNLNRKPAA